MSCSRGWVFYNVFYMLVFYSREGGLLERLSERLIQGFFFKEAPFRRSMRRKMSGRRWRIRSKARCGISNQSRAQCRLQMLLGRMLLGRMVLGRMVLGEARCLWMGRLARLCPLVFIMEVLFCYRASYSLCLLKNYVSFRASRYSMSLI